MSNQSYAESQRRFLDRLDTVVAKHSMLEHPFYQAWSAGSLSIEALREYSKQYFAHVRRFPTYVSAVHSRCDDLPTRQELLDNLIEEERGPNNHPELWLRFAEGLGASRDSVLAADLLPQTRESVAVMQRLTCSDDYLDGVAALYAYESQVPDVALTKREGLKASYGVDDPAVVEYFTVHEEADVLHREGERRILAQNCMSPEKQAAALEAAETAAKALWTFLDGVQEACVTAGS
ncbi:MAG: CADD family putative folate metabolism protein [Gemmatimonadota bacterium]|nr:MAG: CADD family putative folate metabolism protein [Gemmatimonadota bacterium]